MPEIDHNQRNSQTSPLRLPWWKCGILGGIVLSSATLIKVIGAIPRFFTEDVPWSEFVFLPFAVFGMGFVCGSLVGVLRGLSSRLGIVGDVVIGAAVMNIYFLCCMALFDPKMLSSEALGGAMMLFFATVTGMIGGAWLGNDLRRDMKQTFDATNRTPPDSSGRD